MPNIFANILGGAASGAATGSVAGPYGTVLGALGGALGGGFRARNRSEAQDTPRAQAAGNMASGLIGTAGSLMAGGMMLSRERQRARGLQEGLEQQRQRELAIAASQANAMGGTQINPALQMRLAGQIVNQRASETLPGFLQEQRGLRQETHARQTQLAGGMLSAASTGVAQAVGASQGLRARPNTASPALTAPPGPPAQQGAQATPAVAQQNAANSMTSLLQDEEATRYGQMTNPLGLEDEEAVGTPEDSLRREQQMAEFERARADLEIARSRRIKAQMEVQRMMREQEQARQAAQPRGRQSAEQVRESLMQQTEEAIASTAELPVAEARSLYSQASALEQEGRLGESLAILKRLQQSNPNPSVDQSIADLERRMANQ